MMRIALIMLCSFIALIEARATEIHFSSGGTFHAQRLTGAAYVTCDQGRGRRMVLVQCDQDELSPGEYDAIVTDSDLDITSVTLKNKVGHKEVVQKRNFDKKRRRTTRDFNLWIWSLTQSGLLDYGKNMVTFELARKNQTPIQGQFEVTVVDDGIRRCPTMSFYSNNFMDCQPGSTMVCGQYFNTVRSCY